jgi:hypothetical protein
LTGRGDATGQHPAIAGIKPALASGKSAKQDTGPMPLLRDMPVSQSDISNALADAASLLTLGSRPNVLFVGNGMLAGVAFEQLLETCAQPWHVARLPGEMGLPLPTEGTLILNDVAALTPVQQAALNVWLEAGRPRVQIVSITAKPLEAHVKAGQFDEKLFYRLNVVRCDVQCA